MLTAAAPNRAGVRAVGGAAASWARSSPTFRAGFPRAAAAPPRPAGRAERRSGCDRRRVLRHDDGQRERAAVAAGCAEHPERARLRCQCLTAARPRGRQTAPSDHRPRPRRHGFPRAPEHGASFTSSSESPASRDRLPTARRQPERPSAVDRRRPHRTRQALRCGLPRVTALARAVHGGDACRLTQRRLGVARLRYPGSSTRARAQDRAAVAARECRVGGPDGRRSGRSPRRPPGSRFG